jgi:hypothetical protein
MIYQERIEQARNWLGSRWLLAEQVNKPARCHVRTAPTVSRWIEFNQQIARILAGSEHV